MRDMLEMVRVLPEDRMRYMLEMVTALPEDRMRYMLEMVRALSGGYVGDGKHVTCG